MKAAAVPENLNSLVELLKYWAKAAPDAKAFVFLRDGQSDEESVTYGELDRRARLLAGLLSKSTKVGDAALINHQPGLDYIVAFFGCLYRGLVAVPVYPPRFNPKMDKLESIIQQVQPSVALISKSVREALGGAITSMESLKRLNWIESDTLPTEEVQYDSGVIDQNTLAFLQYTSGSTSHPKGVMLSHGNLLHNLESIAQAFETRRGGACVSWLPPYHDMGLVGIILGSLYAGVPCIMMSPFSFLMRPARWLQAITKYKAVYSGAPNFAFDLCVRRISEKQMEGLDLSSWDLAFCGAEPVRAETMMAFTEKFKSVGFRAEALYPCYGMAETALIATGGKRGQGARVVTLSAEELETNRRAVSPDEGHYTARLFVGSGSDTVGNRVEIVDPVTRQIKEDSQVGEIWVTGGSVAQGYWKQPEETERTFKATIAGSDESTKFLRTGDLGFRLDGDIFVTGRIKDLIILRGRNIYPQDVERTVESSHPALNPGACAVVSVDAAGEERLVVISELSRTARDTDLDEVAKAVTQSVFDGHGVNTYAVSLIRTNTIPVTTSGKIRRQLSRQMFLAGELQELKRVVGSVELNA